MRSLPAYLALFGLGYIPAPAADWLNDRGDPQRSGWQQRERGLSAASASQMKLLWKRKLEGPAGISNVLTAPVMLGPLVTHRGIKELVFVAGASNMVYAVDADLGTLFWQRSLKIVVSPPDNSKSGCGAGLTTAPAISPAGGPPRPADQDEGFTPLRPLYVVSSDGTLHSIRPSDGADMAPARKFVPAGTNVSSLNVAGGFVYAAISAGCDRAPAGLWAMNVNDPVAKPVFFPAKSADPGASIGTGGTVYSAAPDGIVSLTAGELAVRQKFSRPAPVSTAPVAFLWKGREWIAGAGPQGVFLLDPTRPAFIDRVPGRGLTGSLATAEDAHGARWLYAAAQGGILAFKLAAAGELPKLSSVWTSANLPAPTSPVVANGIVFTLSTGGTPSLRALDALTGKQLYSSGDALKSSTARSNLAVANGHICFGGADGTLYCFGIPFEI